MGYLDQVRRARAAHRGPDRRAEDGWRGRGFGRRGGGGLSLLTNPAATRSTEGARIFGAATDGSTAFLDWPGVNVLRIENRGDGLGQMALVEGSRTSFILRSNDFANAAWTAVGLTPTSNTNNAPDGTASAATLAFTASATAQISQPLTSIPADNAVYTYTVWLRAAAAQSLRIFMRQKDGVTEGAAVVCTITTVWQRFVLTQSVGAGASAPLMIFRNDADAAARNVFIWHAQPELGAFPSSTIRTTAAAVTRGADMDVYAVGAYPDALRTKGFVMQIAPDFSSADAQSVYVLSPSIGGDPGQHALFITTVAPQLYSGGLLKATRNVSWSRGQLMTITADLPTGTMTVAGATTNNGTTVGTACAWPAEPLGIGITPGLSSASPFFGRYGLTMTVSP